MTFAVGAAVPLVSLLLGPTGMRAVVGSAALTLLALFTVGLVLSVFTGRAALRMLLIGGAAGAVSLGARQVPARSPRGT